MIEVTAFGGFQLTVGGQPRMLANRKSQALLVYLASNSDLAHERAALADLLWPELSPAAAYNNLSKALGQVDAFLTEDGDSPIERTRRTLQAASAPTWQLDAARFGQLVAAAEAATDAERTAALLEDAVTLYRGEFLAGMSLADCPSFEGWLLLQRESLMLAARDSLHWLAGYYLERGDYAAARDTARRQLVLDAWHEPAHRQLMRALDGLGQRAEALRQYEACRDVLRAELGLEPEAATRALYEQIRAGQTTPAAPRQPGERNRPETGLPRRLLPLIGREAELERLRQDLADPACRLITILGGGGVGKTSLALEAAAAVAADFADGAAFVPLEPLRRSDGDLRETLAAAVGAALGLAFTGADSVHHQLERAVRGRELLLVLDNFEHLLEDSPGAPASPAAAFLTDLLEQAPRVKVLATSRQQFGIPMEYVLALAGLAVPDPGAAGDRLSDYASIRLFVEQARRNERSFRLAADNGPAVAVICRLVDGLPLAIELAARWVIHFTCAEIAAAIQENLDFLAAESPQVTERHQSMRATFGYSWQMLPAEEQQMLARLSIIPGRFSRQAALAVTAGSLGHLVRLQGKSLVRSDSPGHYSLHPLLRQFVAEKLDEQPAEDRPALRERFYRYYLHALVAQGEGLNQAWSGEAIKAIGGNIENIRGAWQAALDADAFDLLDASLQPLYHYYRIQGLFHEDRHLFDQAVDHFRRRQAASGDGDRLQELLGRALLRQGRLAFLMGDTEEAMGPLQEGLACLQRAGTARDLSRAYANLGEAALVSGRIAEAEALLDTALTLYREEGDRPGIATTLELQARCASAAQHFAAADRLFEESIALCRRDGNRRLEGRGLHDWGLVLIQQGDVAGAAGRFAESLTIARELELHMPIAFNQCMLGRTERHAGRFEQARALLTDSLTVLEGTGYAFYTTRGLSMLGEVLAILGQTAAARAALDNVLNQVRGLQATDSTVVDYAALDFLVAAAHLLAATAEPERAGRHLAWVLAADGPYADIRQRARELEERLAEQEPEGAATDSGRSAVSPAPADALAAFAW